MISRYGHDIVIAFESILGNKLRSFLTALGIIFGVAAVISMLAIGRGAQQEILEQIKMVGVNNIMIIPIVEAKGSDEESNNSQEGEKRKFSPGLHREDVQAIKEVLPSVKMISPEIAVNSFVVQGGRRESAKLLGVSSTYFEIFNMNIEEGDAFTPLQEEDGLPVCIIGANIARKFFRAGSPVGQYIKFDQVWLRVIGVLERTNIELSRFEHAGVNVMNDNIYVPVKTTLLRFQNRALVSSRIMNVVGSRFRRGGGFPGFSMSTNVGQNSDRNYHQLDKIVVQVNDSEEIEPATEVLGRLIFRRHQSVKDFEITVPELLLKQEQRTKDVFNIVLGAIASISLIVGGIGIMNIMFASVMERIREIGTRLAIGAKKNDIVVQFLAEAVLISVSGGIVGVILGIVASKLINEFSGILTIVSPYSVLIAFLVSASVGIIFGYSPAKRASEKDPIESLRYE